MEVHRAVTETPLAQQLEPDADLSGGEGALAASHDHRHEE
jgi:hypothetical protein